MDGSPRQKDGSRRKITVLAEDARAFSHAPRAVLVGRDELPGAVERVAIRRTPPNTRHAGGAGALCLQQRDFSFAPENKPAQGLAAPLHPLAQFGRHILPPASVDPLAKG